MPYGLRFLNRSCERTIRGAAASTVQVKYGGCGVCRETCNSAPNSAFPRLRVEDNTSLIDGLWLGATVLLRRRSAQRRGRNCFQQVECKSLTWRPHQCCSICRQTQC